MPSKPEKDLVTNSKITEENKKNDTKCQTLCDSDVL